MKMDDELKELSTVWSGLGLSRPTSSISITRPARRWSSTGLRRDTRLVERRRVAATRRSTRVMGMATARLTVDRVNPLAASHRLGCFSGSQNTPDILVILWVLGSKRKLR